MRSAVWAVAWCLVAGWAAAQETAPPKRPPARSAAKAAAPAPALPSGKGWRSAPQPAWVVEPPAPAPGLTAAPNAGGRREQLYDVQTNHALPRPQTFVRWRAVALDPAALAAVSQPQIHFNPAFQAVQLHSVAVLRDGQRLERLAQARIEPMRREQRLEQQVIDGNETLLVVVSDVRVGEPVEVVYTIEGENPIFEGRIATTVQLSYQAPVDRLHYRLIVPAGRELQLRGLATDVQAERLSEGGHQIVRVVRHQVPAMVLEQNVPPWFKAYPALQVSEYHSWAEVDAWAQRLFALPQPAHPAVAARAAAFRDQGLAGAALVSEVLRFVQDEVRYFSVSLGESSHRPKPPQQTLAELLGDCKDKVQLLNALLRELGFDARPALVSLQRNRGVADFLPTHAEFDHVVTQLELDGRSWLLDATIHDQGLTLASRGHWPYGSALVVGGGGELRAAPQPTDALERLDHEQRWDLSKPGQPTVLTVVLRAHGGIAEQWRAGVANAGIERLTEPLAGVYARLAPGLTAAGAPELGDDRRANVLTITQRFTHPEFGRYARGAIEAEFGSIELLDALLSPQEARRRMPWLLSQPRVVESRVVVIAPQPVNFKAPAPFEVSDRHLRYSARLDIDGSTLSFLRRVERRTDQVLPGDVDSFREHLLKARGNVSARLRLALVDPGALGAELDLIDRRLRASRGWRNDALGTIVARNEFMRFVDGKALERAEPGSTLAAQVRASRAQASNLLGDFAAGLADADAALALRPNLDDAREARAVALFGSGQVEQALAEFTTLAQVSRQASVSSWQGSVAYYLGRYEQAEKTLRDALDGSGADDRDFLLIWLYLAAERQGGRGQAAIAPYVESIDPKRFSGALVRFLHGSIDRDALMKQAREKPEFERLNLAEAYFYVGQQFAARGQREEALRWFERTAEIGASPYRETTYAQLELKRAKAVPVR